MRSGFWRKCRVGFRWCRISVLLLVLAVVCSVAWFNRVGLPDFLKTRLVAALHEHGIELEFTRMRLRFGHGIVADNVRIGRATIPGTPTLSLAEIQLQLDYRALWRRQLRLAGLTLRQGKFLCPVSPTNSLQLDNIQTELRFETNDLWSLDNFQADFAGAKLTLSGEIAHAPELRGWKMFHGSGSTNVSGWRAQLQKFSDTLDQIHFEGTPLLNVTVDGDALDIHSFSFQLLGKAPAVRTPWFRARDIQLTANLTMAAVPPNLDPSWSFWTNVQPYQLEWSARFTRLRLDKLNADSIACGGFWRAPELVVTNLSAELGDGKLDVAAKLNVATRELSFTNSSCFDFHALDALLTGKTSARLADFSWPQPPSLQVGGSLVLPAWTNRAPDWNGEVRPSVRLAGELAFTNGTVMGAQIDSARTHFSYLDLVWQLPDLALAQKKTHLEINGFEDDATKKYRWQIRGALDPEAARPFLTASNAMRGLTIVKLSEPLALDVDVSGRLYDYDRIAADGRLSVTNFSVRGEHVGDVTAVLNYTNRVLEFLQPLMHTGAQMATADSVTLDFNQRLIFFTNAFSIADLQSVTRAIGPKTARLVEPYHFLQPPTARVNGQIPLGDLHGGREMADVDMRFDVIKSAPFEWLKLKTTNIVGTLHWRGQTLLLTNVAAAFYGGSGTGFAYFDFRVPHEGADYQYEVNVTNVNLHLLAVDLSTTTNHLEGTLAGQLVVTNASTENWRTLSGHGRVNLRDGLLWDIPVVSILSPVLNAVSPGLGNSRATEASAKFVITNGIIFTDSLEIRSTMTRLEYSGTIDLYQNVNAHVTAHLLRDTWVVGPLVSTVLWPVSKLFEYRVTGSLKDPKSEPIYALPKLLLFPLHPIRSLEQIFPADDNFMNTPAGN